jgi:hypothetical protein
MAPLTSISLSHLSTRPDAHSRREERASPHSVPAVGCCWLLAAAPRRDISSMYHHHDDTVHISMARRILWRCEETARHVQGRYARSVANVIHRASIYHIQIYMQYGDVVLVEEYDTGISPSRWSCLSLCLFYPVSAARSGTFVLWQVDTEVECCEMTMLIDRGRRRRMIAQRESCFSSSSGLFSYWVESRPCWRVRDHLYVRIFMQQIKQTNKPSP